MKKIFHKKRFMFGPADLTFIHVDSLDCWCQPVLVEVSDGMTLEEFESEFASETIRQEKAIARWIH
jgi:hypothetical protein